MWQQKLWAHVACPGCYSNRELLNLHSGHTSSTTEWSINNSVQEQGVIQRLMGSCGHCRGLDSQESWDRKKPGCGSRVFSEMHSVGDPATRLFYLLLTLWGLLMGSSRGSLRAPCRAWTHLSFSKRCHWAARGLGKVHLEKEPSPAVGAEGRKPRCAPGREGPSLEQQESQWPGQRTWVPVLGSCFWAFI